MHLLPASVGTFSVFGGTVCGRRRRRICRQRGVQTCFFRGKTPRNSRAFFPMAAQPYSAAGSGVQHLAVDENSAGQRLDNFLQRHMKGVPKSHIYRLIRSGQVRVDGRRAQADTRLESGVQVRLPPVRVAQPDAPRAVPPREFALLHEDDALLVINKPAGVAVHGGSGVSFGVIEQLRRARPQQRFLELVHRLDRETSGTLVLAKKRSALTALQAAFRERRVKKRYLALALGAWPEKLHTINAPLRKYVDAAQERRVAIAAAGEPGAMPALTRVRVQRRFAGFTLLEVQKNCVAPLKR